MRSKSTGLPGDEDLGVTTRGCSPFSPIDWPGLKDKNIPNNGN